METNATTPFPRRFEVRYSLDEALRYSALRAHAQRTLAGPGHTWTRLIVVGFLVSGLALVAQGLGSLPASGVPFVAVLISIAFIIGVCVAWMEVGRMSKGVTKVLHAKGIGFGPWDVVVSDDGLEAKTRGYGFWLRFADLQDVSVDDAFVVLRINPASEFPIPMRCLGDDAAARAFERFVDAKRATSQLQPT